VTAFPIHSDLLFLVCGTVTTPNPLASFVSVSTVS
jgi:hypothetical protein